MLIAACRLSLPRRRASGAALRAQLLRGTWDLPGPGTELVAPALLGRPSAPGPPREASSALHSLNVVFSKLIFSRFPEDYLQKDPSPSRGWSSMNPTTTARRGERAPPRRAGLLCSPGPGSAALGQARGLPTRAAGRLWPPPCPARKSQGNRKKPIKRPARRANKTSNNDTKTLAEQPPPPRVP